MSAYNSPQNRARWAMLVAISDAVVRSGEPPLRFRKVTGILNAMTMPIEDGGDDPVVVGHLFAALEAAVRVYISEPGATDVLQTVAAFRRAETRRRK
jgi:hypothetical protein